MNKRGQSWKPFIWFGAIIVIFILGFLLVSSIFWKNWSAGLVIDTTVQGFEGILGSAFGWMNWIFGGVPSWLVSTVGGTSAVIITIATFVVLFVTFGDIIQNFSTFSKQVAWISAFAIALIAANLKAIVVVLGFFIGVFAFLGGLAVVAGLVAAFLAFFAVNWGIRGFGPWLMRRRAFMHADKEATKAEAGGIELAGKIKGLMEAGEGLKGRKGS